MCLWHAASKYFLKGVPVIFSSRDIPQTHLLLGNFKSKKWLIKNCWVFFWESLFFTLQNYFSFISETSEKTLSNINTPRLSNVNTSRFWQVGIQVFSLRFACLMHWSIYTFHRKTERKNIFSQKPFFHPIEVIKNLKRKYWVDLHGGGGPTSFADLR